MHVLLVNGSPHEKGCTYTALMEVAGALEAEGVYASTGSACSSKKRKVSPVLMAMGLPVERAECALRFSLSPYTTVEEIDYAADVLGRVWPQLRRFQRR